MLDATTITISKRKLTAKNKIVCLRCTGKYARGLRQCPYCGKRRIYKKPVEKSE